MDEKSAGPQTNEQIIEELTRDLESSCIKADDGKDVASDNGDNVNNASSAKTLAESEQRREQAEGDGSTDLLDDEEALKDRDLTLSESEKEALKEEAEKLKCQGNDWFKSGEYRQAIDAYTRGLRTCPFTYARERSVLYANRAAAESKCLNKEAAIADCGKAVELNPEYAKAYARRARLYEETEKLDEALEDYKKVLSLDPSDAQANHAVRRLPVLIDERNEKLKAEMLGKLKDLGNMVLKPFGLSTSNFAVEKDPNSGGYSVKFHQNPS